MARNEQCKSVDERDSTLGKRLLYRRQFLLSREPVHELGEWKHLRIDKHFLYLHPDLELTVREENSVTAILVGYIFDPRHPSKTNDEIIKDIILGSGGLGDLIGLLKFYVGRYALLYRDKNHFVCFHDAYGVREIYYCTQYNSVICGSQPNLLDRFSKPKLGITKDQDIVKFYKHEMKPVRLGRLWVGDETYVQDVKHLIANHYLDIESLKAKRYWPNKRLEKINLSTGSRLSCSFLKGAIKAVTQRYNVMMAVTAGYDSRSLLAASRDVCDRIYYFINKEPGMNDQSADIRIPKNIFKKLNIPFHVHDVDGPVDEEFKNIYLNNAFWAIEKSLPTIFNVYFKNHQDKVNLLGLGEIGRVYYGDTPRDLDGYYLARSLKYKRSRYAVRQCEKWLLEAKKLGTTYNFDVMKLFLWEFLIANWGAIGNAESDIAIEEFDPYSSHYILEIMLSVDQRQGDIFREMFRETWPELLEFPFNPPATASDRMKELLNKTGLFQHVKNAKYRFDRWKYRRTINSGY